MIELSSPKHDIQITDAVRSCNEKLIILSSNTAENLFPVESFSAREIKYMRQKLENGNVTYDTQTTGGIDALMSNNMEKRKLGILELMENDFLHRVERASSFEALSRGYTEIQNGRQVGVNNGIMHAVADILLAASVPSNESGILLANRLNNRIYIGAKHRWKDEPSKLAIVETRFKDIAAGDNEMTQGIPVNSLLPIWSILTVKPENVPTSVILGAQESVNV